MTRGSTPTSSNDSVDRGLLAGALVCVLAACGGRDPILDRADEIAVQQGVHDVADPPAPSTSGAPPVGQPEQPAPGVPDEPSPGGIEVMGPSVVLSGTVDVPGWKGGTIRIDIFDGDQQAAASTPDKRPRVVAMARLEKPGPFEMRVPTTAAKVWLGAYADENADGKPDPTDPEVWFGGNPIATDMDHRDVNLTLTTTATAKSTD